MFAAGSQIGKYVLGRKLGQGGFGAVFAAYDESLDRELALKILNAEHKASEDVMRRFLQEARLAARIGHPGIVTVFECALLQHTNTPADGVAYIAMELLDGEALSHRLHRAGRMSVTGALEVARQIASALEAAHKHGIVHRDLKPDNIFLVKDPAVIGGERVKVLDFGIAKLHHVQSGVHTQTSEVFGTPRYMSPEQCRSSTQIDARSDIYTLGCIVFELITGRPPFVGQTGELFAQHLMVEAPSVLAFVRDTPYHVADLVRRMLAKEPDARPASMADVQRELEAGGALPFGVFGVPPTLPPGASSHIPVAAPTPPSSSPSALRDSTLNAAAGVSVSTRNSTGTPRAAIAAAAGIAIAIAVGLVLWLRGASSDPPAQIATAAPSGRATPSSQPKPTPTAKQDTDAAARAPSGPRTELSA
ncbi:MAG TPA: serine/threonine-protein kinase, partial [Kofleriaceae bacterium]|nr:serine/threonine-protein kinase [Kofleriaceae bacterium]